MHAQARGTYEPPICREIDTHCDSAILCRGIVWRSSGPSPSSPTATRSRHRTRASSRFSRGDDALLEAVADGDAEATAALIAEGANVNHLSAEHDWATPTIVAAQEGALECLKLLLEVPHVEFNRADKFGFTASHMAAHWDRADCLQLLLEAGANASLRAAGAR